KEGTLVITVVGILDDLRAACRGGFPRPKPRWPLAAGRGGGLVGGVNDCPIACRSALTTRRMGDHRMAVRDIDSANQISRRCGGFVNPCVDGVSHPSLVERGSVEKRKRGN